MGHKMMDNEKERKKNRKKREDKKEERACHGLTGGHPKRQSLMIYRKVTWLSLKCENEVRQSKREF